MGNVQISEDLFTDLMMYFGVGTEASPTEYRRQQICDKLSLKVQAINNRIRYKQHLGYERTSAQNASDLSVKEEDLAAENRRLAELYEQGRRLGYHD